MKQKVQIAAIQEIRWTGKGIMDTSSHTILYSGKDSNSHEEGVGFIVDKKLKQTILDFKPHNERIAVLRIKTKFFNLCIINIYAPT